jgi:hypothetical protein
MVTPAAAFGQPDRATALVKFGLTRLSQRRADDSLQGRFPQTAYPVIKYRERQRNLTAALFPEKSLENRCSATDSGQYSRFNGIP